MYLKRFTTSALSCAFRRITFRNYESTVLNGYKWHDRSGNKSYSAVHQNKNYDTLKQYNERENQQVSKFEESLNKLSRKRKNSYNVTVLEFRSALELMKKEKCGTEDQCVLLLQCSELLLEATPSDRVNLTLETWNTIQSFGAVTLDCYHAFLISLADCQYKIDSNKILQEINELGLKPNEELYLRLLHNVCSVGDVEQATCIISTMKDAGIPLKDTAFDCIILGHGRAGNTQEIENTLSLMKDSLLKPTSSTFTSMIQVAAEAGNKKLCTSYYNEYRTKLSDTQRLKIVESLAVGQLNDLIPEVLSGGSWGYSAETENKLRNTCMKLICNGYVDSAYKLFKTLSDYIDFSDSTTNSAYGTFFLQEIVKANVPVLKIIEICGMFKVQNPNALLTTTQAALRSCNVPLALQLLQLLVNEGIKLRPHYFWPLFVHTGKHNGESGVLEILESMLSMGVTPDHDTLAEWVCIHCDSSEPVELVRKLQDKGLKLKDVLSPVVQCLLQKNDVHGAAVVCNKFKSTLNWKKQVSYISMEYLRTEDVSSVKTILNLVKEKSAGSDIVDFILSQQRVPINEDTLKKLVQGLQEAGYVLPQQQFNCVKDYPSAEISRSNITLFPFPKTTNVGELEAQLIQLKSKHMNIRGVLRRLLQEHSRLRNVKRVLEVKKELDENGFELSPGMMASLVQTFVEGGDANEAEKCLKLLRETHPQFKIDIYKIIDLAILYVRSSRYEDAKKLLTEQKDVKPHESFSKYCPRLLNAVSEYYGPDETIDMFNLLITKKYSNVSNHLLGCIIRSYIVKEDLVNAVTTYEKLALENKCTPLQHELFCALLKNKNKIKQYNADVAKHDLYLQLIERVLKIGVRIHGKQNTNVAYTVALAECNLMEQLKQFIKTPGNKLDIKILQLRCKRLSDESKPDVILRIISVLKDLPSVNIWNFYDVLLQTYVRQGDCEGALSLWTLLQEENVVVSEKFLKTLKSFLDANKKNAPFAPTKNS